MSVMTSSMPMVATGNNDGFGGGSGIWAIVLVALFACGGGGWGGNRGGADNAEINGRFNSLENQLENLGNREDLRGNLMETCKTNMNVTEQAYDLSKQVAQNRFDDALGFKDVELQLAQCCCNQAANIQSAKQEILDKLSCNEIKALEGKIADLQRQIPVGSYITYPSNLPIYPPVSAGGYAGIGGYGFGGCGGF